MGTSANPDELEDWYDDGYDRVLETGQPLKLEREPAPQSMVPTMYVVRVEEDARTRQRVVIQDIVARRRAEEALAKTRRASGRSCRRTPRRSTG